MKREESGIPGIEIIPPTIFSAKEAARAALAGEDMRSPIGLLGDLALAYVSLPEAEAREEADTYGSYGRRTFNPWRRHYMRKTVTREIAVETENGPYGIELIEKTHHNRRRFMPGIRRLGHLVFHNEDKPIGGKPRALLLATLNIDGSPRHTWVNLNTWAEMDVPPVFTTGIYGPILEQMLALPDVPTPIVPYPDELRKKD